MAGPKLQERFLQWYVIENKDRLPLINGKKVVQVIPILRNAGVITGDYWRHDLRRTVSTTLAKLGIPRAVLSQVLNQQDGGPRATAIYDRYNYDREKQKALETWGRHLDALLTGHTSRVVPFAGGRPRR